MKITSKYEVMLIDDNYILDSAEFDTFDEALDWSLEYGKNYNVNILHDNISYDFRVCDNSIIYYDLYDRTFRHVKKEDVRNECVSIIDPEQL